MSTVYLKDVESSAVLEAQRDRDRLDELGIKSPDISKMNRLKIDNQTMFYFGSKQKRDVFISKYYNRRKKIFEFDKDKNINDDE